MAKKKKESTESKINDLNEIGRVFKLIAIEFRLYLNTRKEDQIKNIALNFDKLSVLCQKIEPGD